MLDVKLVRNATEAIAAQLKKRGFLFDTAKFVALESERKQLQVNLQELQNERNVRSKAVGLAKSAGQSTDEPLAKLKEISESIKSLEAKFAQTQNELDDFLYALPNILHDSVPIGVSEENNEVVRTWGEPTVFSFTPKDHVDLGVSLGVRAGFMDFEAAAKMSGARFVVLRGPLARLQRALIQFMMDLHTGQHGYQEISVPYLVLADALFGTGQLPKFKEDLFAIKSETERYLISTSEIPVTNTVRDEIIDVTRLPIKYVCYSSCFRSEAGSYGKDMRGMLRQHQFEKVELVHIVKPELSYQALETLTQHAEVVLQKLELPYRIVTLCSGDVGFSAAKTYDLEVWLPGQSRYREISSCSNMEAFQARRMKARFRNEAGDIEWVHTLNGSGLAVGRTLIAILENYQDELGRIRVPTVLQSYMGGLQVIE